MFTYANEREFADTESIYLDANESHAQWLQLPSDLFQNLHRYPDTNSATLKRALSQYCSRAIKEKNILVTAGSIEAIDLLLYGLKPQRLIVNTPTYDLYVSRATTHQIETIAIDMNEWDSVNYTEIMRYSEIDSMLVLINPNNPSGKLLKKEVVLRLLKNFAGTIVIDEAYIEFAGLKHSYESYIRDHENLVILRTFSKAWGLAGIRVGYILAQESIILELARHKAPYNVSRLSIAIAIEAIAQQHKMLASIEETKRLKQTLEETLKLHDITTHPTDTNFILIEIPDPTHIQHILKSHNILTRVRRIHWRNKDMLRVTIGSSNDNNAFARTLLHYLAQQDKKEVVDVQNTPR